MDPVGVRGERVQDIYRGLHASSSSTSRDFGQRFKKRRRSAQKYEGDKENGKSISDLSVQSSKASRRKIQDSIRKTSENGDTSKPPSSNGELNVRKDEERKDYEIDMKRRKDDAVDNENGDNVSEEKLETEEKRKEKRQVKVLAEK